MKHTHGQEEGPDGEGGSADVGPVSAIRCPWRTKVCRGLNGIGLTVIVMPQASGFLTGVRIVAGELHVAPDCPASDAQHEAGHLTVMPGR